MATYYVATTGNDTTGDGSVGNPFATPGKAAAVATSFDDYIYVKAGTYTMTTDTPGPGGPVLFASAIRVTMEGYETTPGDRTGVRPVLSWGAVAAPLAASYLFSGLNNGGQNFLNMEADGNNVNNVRGFNLNNFRWRALQCVVKNCRGTNGVGFLVAQSSQGVRSCFADNCLVGFSGFCYPFWCHAKNCGTGFDVFGPSYCLATECTGNGFALGNAQAANNCVADDCDGNGFSLAPFSSAVNCIASNCLGVGKAGFDVGVAGQLLQNCASYNNTVDISGTPDVNIGFVPNASFSGSPWTGAGDYRPNATAGAGALLRAAGIGVYGQIDSRDIGAVQHGGTTRPRIYVGGRLRT